MPHPYWPLFDLRVRTPSVELRLPTDDDLVTLARLAGDIHDPEATPFGVPWTDRPSPEFERGVFQFNWRQRAAFSPEEWHLPMLVVAKGRPAGLQEIFAVQFPIRRVVETGSWLNRAFQGQGIGKEMRAAALHVAFEGLGAAVAYSAAWHDNAPSLGISSALGYQHNGDVIELRRDQADRQVKLKLERRTWERRRRDDIVIENLEPCLDLFGLGA